MLDTTSDIQIINAEPKDATVIASILYEAFVGFKPLYTQKAFQATAIPPEEVLKRMKEGRVLLAVIDNKAVGTVSTVGKKEGYYIRGMAVLPEARGQNIGWQLLTTTESAAYTEGYSRLFLCTTTFLTPAIKLYTDFGFKRIEDNYDSFFGTRIFSMEKELENSNKL